GYRGFGRQGFRIAAVFDSDREKVGREIGGLTVHHLDDLPELARSEQIRMAVVTVPIESAQTVVDQLVAAGIEGILNFAPVTLSLDSGTNVQGVDLAMELEQLSFAVINRLKSER
ncbi:MAG: hypothetical protein KDA41_10580, partial [Planctomycetales bacterium]|nr:hypothetical protein [Planctomycetales bacterium]